MLNNCCGETLENERAQKHPPISPRYSQYYRALIKLTYFQAPIASQHFNHKAIKYKSNFKKAVNLIYICEVLMWIFEKVYVKSINIVCDAI